jgi:predicted nuclease of predicted toxin-antitoxin system
MARATTKLRLFTDENIPDSVARYLQGRGHSVFRAKAHLPEGSPDPIVAAAAMEHGRILVTWDRDFNDQRFMRARFARLSRIGLSGTGPELVVAMRRHIRMIEFAWSEKLRTGAPRMIAFAKIDGCRFRT